MITFLRRRDDEACLKIICGDLTRCVAAVQGEEVVSLDNVLNDIVEDENIKHVKLAVSFTDDEHKVHEYLKSLDQSGSKKQESDEYDEEEEEEDHKDYTCPKCGNKEGALYDKFGNKHPCISCIKTDIGLQLEKKYKKKPDDLEEYNKKLGDEYRN